MSALKRARAESIVLDVCVYGTSYQTPTRLVGTLRCLRMLGFRCRCDVPHEHLCGLVRVDGVTILKISLA